jgi:hypothetical protein
MKSFARALTLTAAVAIGLSVIPVAAVTGSYLATHAVSAAVRKADPLTLAAAPQRDSDGFAVTTPIRTAAR